MIHVLILVRGFSQRVKNVSPLIETHRSKIGIKRINEITYRDKLNSNIYNNSQSVKPNIRFIAEFINTINFRGVKNAPQQETE